MKIIKCLVIIVMIVNGIKGDDNKSSHELEEGKSDSRVSKSAENSQESEGNKAGIQTGSAENISKERTTNEGEKSIESRTQRSSDIKTTETSAASKSGEQELSKTAPNSTESVEKISHETKSEDKAKLIQVKEKIMRRGSNENNSAETETYEERKDSGNSEESIKNSETKKAPKSSNNLVTEPEANSKQAKENPSDDNTEKERSGKSDTEDNLKEQVKSNPVVASPIPPSRRMLKSNPRLVDTKPEVARTEVTKAEGANAGDVKTEEVKPELTVEPKARQPNYPYAGNLHQDDENEADTRSGHPSEMPTYTPPSYLTLPPPFQYQSLPSQVNNHFPSSFLKSPFPQMDFKTLEIPKPQFIESVRPMDSLKSHQIDPLKSFELLRPYPIDRRSQQMAPVKSFELYSQEPSLEPPPLQFDTQSFLTQLLPLQPLGRMEPFQRSQTMQAPQMKLMEPMREMEPLKPTSYQRPMEHFRTMEMLPPLTTLPPLMQMPQLATLRTVQSLQPMNAFRTVQNNVNTVFSRLQESSQPSPSQLHRWNTFNNINSYSSGY